MELSCKSAWPFTVFEHRDNRAQAILVDRRMSETRGGADERTRAF